MKCPICNAKSRVVETRRDIARRRECLGPGKHRFATLEILKRDAEAARLDHYKLLEIKRFLQEMES